MTPERWQQVTEIFHAALARDPRDRADFVAEACAGDEQLRREVASMLAQPMATDGFLDRLAFSGTPTHDRIDASVLAGRRLGPYHIEELIGSGGMGDVYRARDTKLGRAVAIKILPRAFTNDPERLARFEREARVLAALNHPHIGAIYGFEEADQLRGLVLELVPGDTLATRLQRGPIGVAETLAIARQIVDALDAAHEKGIVHRDLKPANIKITPEGTVKVLDFGLAKLEPDAREAEANRVRSQSDLPQAPGITLNGTEPGLILGTAPYMSPEQARGQSVDKRADIWAFGCVLFVMLSGREAFGRGTISDTLVAVLQREPEWSALPPMHNGLRLLLQRCLEKDPRRRLRDIGDARLDLDHSSGGATSPDKEASPSARRASPMLWSAGVAVALVTAAGKLARWLSECGTNRKPARERALYPTHGLPGC